MENIYFIIVLVLFVLAISDLIVGVSNDAVNFLNSAIGSKAAPFKIIMGIAALGVLFGATFSNGMMEVARKGIFNPEHFYFSEIMIIFLAVMLTDVILLDTFNTLGLPTSTTVSIVFELLGAAVGVALIKINSGTASLELAEYINSAKALTIISGILLSIVISFTVGAIVQYLTRILFSFDYDKKIAYFGAIWGGIAITAITYFILIKGAKGASFMTSDTKAWIKDNTLLIVAASMAFWSIILQLLKLVAKIDILKLIVLVGTFALAMAFAGNDLVNFIGVPLAGFESYKNFMASGVAADAYSMESLAQKVSTDTYMLLIAGLIMVLALWFSRKARTVVKTELGLSRQTEGEERFGSTMFSRGIVRFMVNSSNTVEKVMPSRFSQWIESRFDQSKATVAVDKEDAPAFDMLRASVNLVVASILISFATSLKLPLSTTYVTFMVAMGTSLADRAWGRESAVYRISGVISVVGGWFMTAFSAFTVALIVAYVLYHGGTIAIFALIALAVFLVYRSHLVHKRKEDESKSVDESVAFDLNNKEKVIQHSTINVQKILMTVSNTFEGIIEGLSSEDRKKLKDVNKEVRLLNKQVKSMKDNVYTTLLNMDDDSMETGQYYVQVMDYLREMAHALTFISQPSFDHVDNNHKSLLPNQVEELNIIKEGIKELFEKINQMIEEGRYADTDATVEKQREMIDALRKYRKNQIKRIKAGEAGTKNSMLYLQLLNETKNFLLYTINLLKSHRDFEEGVK